MTKTIRTLTVDGSVAEPVMVGDTLWSHAATLGRFMYGGEWVTLDRSTIESFIKNFATGYPSKIPVDYEHGTEKETFGQPVPKAGDVVELRGVFGVEDFTDDLKIAAEKIVARNGRELDDPENFGLWIRWRPLARSLAMVKAGEYTEHSIAFSEQAVNPHTGQKQGPTLYSVALTNTPHLDRMNSIAASRRDSDSPPAAPAHSTEHPMTQQANVRLLTAVAAVTKAAPPVDEDQAIQQLTSVTADLDRFRTFTREVSTELGEADTAKAIDKIRKYKSEIAEHEAKAQREKVARVDETIKTVFKDNEGKLLPMSNPTMKFYVESLRRELMEGKELEKTDTMQAIKALKPHGITSQQSAGDDGKPQPSDEDRVFARAKEIAKEDVEVKKLYDAGRSGEAWMLACDKAEQEEEARIAALRG